MKMPRKSVQFVFFASIMVQVVACNVSSSNNEVQGDALQNAEPAVDNAMSIVFTTRAVTRTSELFDAAPEICTPPDTQAGQTQWRWTKMPIFLRTGLAMGPQSPLILTSAHTCSIASMLHSFRLPKGEESCADSQMNQQTWQQFPYVCLISSQYPDKPFCAPLGAAADNDPLKPDFVYDPRVGVPPGGFNGRYNYAARDDVFAIDEQNDLCLIRWNNFFGNMKTDAGEALNVLPVYVERFGVERTTYRAVTNGLDSSYLFAKPSIDLADQANAGSLAMVQSKIDRVWKSNTSDDTSYANAYFTEHPQKTLLRYDETDSQYFSSAPTYLSVFSYAPSQVLRALDTCYGYNHPQQFAPERAQGGALYRRVVEDGQPVLRVSAVFSESQCRPLEYAQWNEADPAHILTCNTAQSVSDNNFYTWINLVSSSLRKDGVPDESYFSSALACKSEFSRFGKLDDFKQTDFYLLLCEKDLAGRCAL